MSQVADGSLRCFPGAVKPRLLPVSQSQADTQEDFKNLQLESDTRGYMYTSEYSEEEAEKHRKGGRGSCKRQVQPVGEDEDSGRLELECTGGVHACIVRKLKLKLSPRAVVNFNNASLKVNWKHQPFFSQSESVELLF